MKKGAGRSAVAVSQRVDVLLDRGERRDALDQQLTVWIARVGGSAHPVPNTLGDCLSDWLDGVAPSALVLSGGNDIGEAPERDHTERQLLNWARTAAIPVLGLCRGMQMMAVWAGGDLRPVAGHVRTRHQLSGALTGDVNSFHAFGLTTCPRGFQVLAKAEDHVVEAIGHRELPWQGWMWHPEREAEFTEADLERARGLFGF